MISIIQVDPTLLQSRLANNNGDTFKSVTKATLVFKFINCNNNIFNSNYCNRLIRQM